MIRVLGVAAVVGTAGCARSLASRGAAADMLCVDGSLVSAGNLSLGDLLRSRSATRPWMSSDFADERGPHVLVDGIVVDGVARLGSIPASEVLTVETFDSDRAVQAFGSRGKAGAIIVTTRVAAGLSPVASTPWPGRCTA